MNATGMSVAPNCFLLVSICFAVLNYPVELANMDIPWDSSLAQESLALYLAFAKRLLSFS